MLVRSRVICFRIPWILELRYIPHIQNHKTDRQRCMGPLIIQIWYKSDFRYTPQLIDKKTYCFNHRSGLLFILDCHIRNCFDIEGSENISYPFPAVLGGGWVGGGWGGWAREHEGNTKGPCVNKSGAKCFGMNLKAFTRKENPNSADKILTLTQIEPSMPKHGGGGVL